MKIKLNQQMFNNSTICIFLTWGHCRSVYIRLYLSNHSREYNLLGNSYHVESILISQKLVVSFELTNCLFFLDGI